MKSFTDNGILIDASGFYSLVARSEKGHEQASNLLVDAVSKPLISRNVTPVLLALSVGRAHARQ